MENKPIKIVTQQGKSLSVREIVHRMQNGLPLNVTQHHTFDLSSDCDFDSVVFDDFSEKLDVMNYHIELSEEIAAKMNDKKVKQPDINNNPKPNQNETQENETP